MDRGTIYITGEARTTMDNAITKIYGVFYIALVVEKATGNILCFDCNATLDLTKDFISKIFVGKNILLDENNVIDEINKRYLASSCRAIIVSYRDALQKYKKLNNID